MKTFTIIFILSLSILAQGDPSCTSLSSYVGAYRLLSKTCNGPFGDQLTVTPYTETREPSYSGFMLTSGGLGIGPATSSNSDDKCVVSGQDVIVYTCAYDQSCLPHGWIYSFSGPDVTFFANGCTAKFKRAP